MYMYSGKQCNVNLAAWPYRSSSLSLCPDICWDEKQRCQHVRVASVRQSVVLPVPTHVSLFRPAGELSRMLPSEMALLAHGWPRKVADNPEGAAAAAAAGGSLVSLSSVGSQDEEGQLIEDQYYLPGRF